MVNEIIGSTPILVICIIALLGVVFNTRTQMQRDTLRQKENYESVKTALRLADCEAYIKKLEHDLEKERESNLALRHVNNALQELLAKHTPSGISVSGGTVNVHGDAFGGDETKHDEYRAGGDVNKIQENK